MSKIKDLMKHIEIEVEDSLNTQDIRQLRAWRKVLSYYCALVDMKIDKAQLKLIKETKPC